MIYLYFLYIIMSEKNRGLISVLVSYVNRLKKPTTRMQWNWWLHVNTYKNPTKNCETDDVDGAIFVIWDDQTHQHGKEKEGGLGFSSFWLCSCVFSSVNGIGNQKIQADLQFTRYRVIK